MRWYFLKNTVFLLKNTVLKSKIRYLYRKNTVLKLKNTILLLLKKMNERNKLKLFKY